MGEYTPEEEAILQVGKAYLEASRALKRGPTSIKELNAYLKKHGDPDKLLISPNDGQAYRINWGVTPMRPSPTAQNKTFLVYEQAGKNGKRYTLDFMLKVRHLSDEEFEAMAGSK
jgi:hypothetical protein